MEKLIKLQKNIIVVMLRKESAEMSAMDGALRKTLEVSAVSPSKRRQVGEAEYGCLRSL